MPIIKANNINVYYELHGAGEPLVLISGFGSDHLVWRMVQDALAKKYQVLVFNNRGVGQTDSPDVPYSIEMFADDTVALCDALNLKQPNFIGHSMGGMITQTIAVKYPDKINSAVICNARAKASKRIELVFKLILDLRKDGVPRERLLECLLPWIFSDEFLEPPEVVPTLTAFYLANPYPQTEVGYARQLEALMNFDFRSQLSKINTPTLVIAGEKDLVTPATEGHVIAETIPNAKFFCVPNAGHVTPVEQPELFVKTVLEFLATN